MAGVPVRIASKRETSGLRSRAQLLTESVAFRLSDAVVVNAEAVRTYLLERGVAPAKPLVIYNAVNLARFPSHLECSAAQAMVRAQLTPALAASRPKFVTMVANMHHEVKGHRMLLSAMRRVCDRLPDAVLLLVGEGKRQETFRALARELGIADNVVFLGHRENVPELMRMSDVCVLSSIAEGFSNSILEYMASMKPVVATDVGGAREAITDAQTGYVVSSGDDVAMAERIILLLGDTAKAREMGQAGRKVIEEQFSRETLVSKTEQLYASLLARNT